MKRRQVLFTATARRHVLRELQTSCNVQDTDGARATLTPITNGFRAWKVPGDPQLVLVALAGLALAPGCGSGARARSQDAAMGTDANDAATSLWETMLQPAIGSGYTSVSLGPPGTVYALERDEGAYAYDGGMNGWLIASSHDDGQTWTTTTIPTTPSAPTPR